ncbi:MAG: hypothetical protein ACE15B_23625 [Bryobacteraceae bacterium]
MKAAVAAIALVVLPAFALPASSGNPIVGKWNCASVNNESGAKVAWTLNVKEDGGKLSASVIVAESGDEIPALEPRIEGNTFSFKVRMNPQETVEVTATVEDKQLTGTFKGKDSGTGAFKGLRAE